MSNSGNDPDVATAPEVLEIGDNNPNSVAEGFKLWLPRLGYCAVVGYMAAAPTAGALGLRTTHVNDVMGTLPITLSLRPGNTSVVKALPDMNVGLDVHKYGLAATVQINDLPPGGIQSLASTKSVQAYAGLLHSPRAVAKGYEAALRHTAEGQIVKSELWLGAAAGLALFGAKYAGQMKIQRKDNLPGGQNNKELQPSGNPPPDISEVTTSERESNQVQHCKRRLVRWLAGLLVVATPAIAVGGSWVASETSPRHGYALGGLDGKALKGAYTDNQSIYELIEQGIPKAKVFIKREDAQTATFNRTATYELKEQKDLISGPRSNEIAVFIGSDDHSSKVMTGLSRLTVRLINQKFGKDTIKFAYFGGDLDYGTSAEDELVHAEGSIANGAPEYTVIGNHDTPISKQQIKDAHIKIVEGHTTDAGTGMILSGGDDPEETPFLQPNEKRKGDDQTETQLGQELFRADSKQPADITAAHEGYAIGSYLGLKHVTQKLMTDWFAKRGSNTVPWDDGVRDLPTRLLIYGHWHRIIAPRTVWNSDGSWTEVMELNTMGGAIASPTFNHFSTPWGAPQQTASFPIVFMDKASGLVTGYQMYTFDTDGSVKISPRIDIGLPLSSQQAAAGSDSRVHTYAGTKLLLPKK